VEVHDFDDQLNKVKTLLLKHNYDIIEIAEDSQVLKLMNVTNVYAKRKD